MESEKPHIDQNALSRQLAVYGHEAQGKLMSLRVFIHGVTGVSIIIIKARGGSCQKFDTCRSKASNYLRPEEGDSGGRWA